MWSFSKATPIHSSRFLQAAQPTDKKERDKQNAISKARRAQTADGCEGEESSLCYYKGYLTKMSGSGPQESKQWLILGLNSQVKVWYNTHPRKKQVCRHNALNWAWSFYAFSIQAISRLPPLLPPYLLPANVISASCFFSRICIESLDLHRAAQTLRKAKHRRSRSSKESIPCG